jgi:hypothetical protein
VVVPQKNVFKKGVGVAQNSFIIITIFTINRLCSYFNDAHIYIFFYESNGSFDTLLSQIFDYHIFGIGKAIVIAK